MFVVFAVRCAVPWCFPGSVQIKLVKVCSSRPNFLFCSGTGPPTGSVWQQTELSLWDIGGYKKA